MQTSLFTLIVISLHRTGHYPVTLSIPHLIKNRVTLRQMQCVQLFVFEWGNKAD